MKKLKKTVLCFCIFLSSFLVFLIPFGAKTKGLDSRFGINAFVLNRYDQQELDRPVSAMKDLGAGFSREEFIWESIEPEKGVFQWEPYDKAVNLLSSSGIGILGILDYSAPWATEDPGRADADKYMPNIADWQNYVAKVIDRYKGNVSYWQIWNEPNVPIFFRPEPDAGQYLEILKSAYEIIKQKDPNAQVVLAGTSGVDRGYLEELKSLGANNYFDILAVHPYSFDFHSPPEDVFLSNMNSAQNIADELGSKPIWLTEFGWPTDNSEGVAEDVQARYLSRLYLLSYQFPDVEKLFWYDLRNDGNDINDRENNFGLINRDYTVKPSYYAYKNLINILGNSQFVSANINDEKGIYDLSFIKGSSTIRAVWKTEGLDTIAIDGDASNTKILNFVGDSVAFQIKDGAIIADISDAPTFIIENKQ